MNKRDLDLLFSPPLDRLATYTDDGNTARWYEHQPDYVAELGLGPEHIHNLTLIATLWYEPGEPLAGTPWDQTPLHAWRALGQLRALEAVEPLLSITNAMDEEFSFEHLEEFPIVYGMIGPKAMPTLTAYLHDPANRDFARVSASNGLSHIARQFPEARPEVVSILSALLARSSGQSESMNGSLVGHLLDLRAVESAEIIERAYAAQHVDESHCGYWGDVRKELGVEGLGLAPEGRTPDRVSDMDRAGDELRKALAVAFAKNETKNALGTDYRPKSTSKNARKRDRRKRRGK